MAFDFSGTGVNGILNTKSKSFIRHKTIYYRDIVRNELNTISIEGIESLAVSISNMGLMQPLMVKPIDDDKYMLLGGERRYTAIKSLIEQGQEKFEDISCMVVDISAVDLPISDELKEKYAIATTNFETRGFIDGASDFDRMETIALLKEVYTALKAAGVEMKGKQKDIIAGTLGISSRQVQRYTAINANLSEDLKQDMKAEKVPLTVATSAAALDEEEQAQLHKQVQEKGELTQQDVDAVKEKREQKGKKEELNESLTQEVYIKSKEDLATLIESVDLITKELAEPITFKKGDYVKYLLALDKAEKAIQAAQKVIDKVKQQYQ